MTQDDIVQNTPVLIYSARNKSKSDFHVTPDVALLCPIYFFRMHLDMDTVESRQGVDRGRKWYKENIESWPVGDIDDVGD